MVSLYIYDYLNEIAIIHFCLIKYHVIIHYLFYLDHVIVYYTWMLKVKLWIHPVHNIESKTVFFFSSLFLLIFSTFSMFFSSERTMKGHMKPDKIDWRDEKQPSSFYFISMNVSNRKKNNRSKNHSSTFTVNFTF